MTSPMSIKGIIAELAAVLGPKIVRNSAVDLLGWSKDDVSVPTIAKTEWVPEHQETRWNRYRFIVWKN